MIRIGLLGPVDVSVDGGRRPLGGMRRRTILAVLGLSAGTTVSVDRLTDVVWGQNPPATVGNTIQSHISYLRALLGDRRAIVGRAGGYLLDLAPQAIDAIQAEQLIKEATRSGGDSAATVGRLRHALSLWRGVPLADVADSPWLRDRAESLENLKLQAIGALTDARLDAGEHAQLVPELQRLADAHPWREPLHAQLMVALYRSGRQAEALMAFERLRAAFADDLGIDPSQELRDLHAAILRQDPSLTIASTVDIRGLVPAQLPLALSSFGGREAELALLDTLADGPSPVVAAIWGTAGVGKTALALHWAHRNASRFPDGQLFASLRGFDPSGVAADPVAVLHGFLGALGIAPGRVPSSVDAMAGLYRSLLAGKQVLVVLDDARDEAQLRPLLPGSPGAFVLVTSRTRLTGLVTAQGARPLELSLPDAIEARRMLAQRLGAARIEAEPGAVDQIIALCARLPLALAVAAAIAEPGTLRLADVAARLRGPAAQDPAAQDLAAQDLAAQDSGTCLATHRLGRVQAGDCLASSGILERWESGDAATDIRAVLAASYSALNPGAARLFRHLGLGFGGDIGAEAAASLAAIPVSVARRQLSELARASLVTDSGNGRYGFHDLLRAYSLELAEDPQPARLRLFEHYLHSAYAAVSLMNPRCYPLDLGPAGVGVTVAAPADVDEAIAWFAAEEKSLLTTAHWAEFAGSWKLVWLIGAYLDRDRRWPEMVSVLESVLPATERANDLRGQAQIRRVLGAVTMMLGRYEVSDAHRREALRLYGVVGDRAGQAGVRLGWASSAQLQGDTSGALRQGRLALRDYETLGNRLEAANARNSVAWFEAHLGRYQSALKLCETSIAELEELGDRHRLAGALDTLGFVRAAMREHGPAIEAYQRSVNLFRELGVRREVAQTLTYLAEVHERIGETEAAQAARAEARSIMDSLGPAR